MGNNVAWAGLGGALQTGGDAFSKAKAARNAQALAQQEADYKFPKPPVSGPDGSMPPMRPLSNEDAFKYENALRDEYTKASKDFNSQTSALGRIEESVKKPSAAGDLALIFNYMKMLDPGSTVREGEFANAQNAASIPDQVRNAWNKAVSGERLNPKQREDFYRSSRRTFGGALGTQKRSRESYRGLAQRYGAKPENVLTDFADPKWYEEGGFNPEDISALGKIQEAIQAQQGGGNPIATPPSKAAKKRYTIEGVEP